VRQHLAYVVLRRPFLEKEALMAEQLNKTLSDFIRVCDELLIEPQHSLAAHELDILDGYINELIERFLTPSDLT
jgi:hypothetical protein